MRTWNPKNEQETIEVGNKIAASLKGGDVVLLYGELGAGKTTLTKGIATALGIKKNITSPTFTLMNVYTLKKPIQSIKELAHIDTYRMKDEQELLAIGVKDYLDQKNTLTIIEWPEKLSTLLEKSHVIKISIKHTKQGRTIQLSN